MESLVDQAMEATDEDFRRHMFLENLESRDVINMNPTVITIKIQEDVEEIFLGNNQKTNQQPKEPYVLGRKVSCIPSSISDAVFRNLSTTQE